MSMDVRAVEREIPGLSPERYGELARLRGEWLDGGACGSRQRMRAWFRFRIARGDQIGWFERLTAKIVGRWP